MAFDACMMRAVIAEINKDFTDAKIEKVHQPQNDEVDLIIHSGKNTGRLVFNLGPSAPRMQLSDISRENPLKAPMFCMLLRKHIGGARIIEITQPGFDRIAIFKLSCYDEMGFQTEKHLICEIMGKYANLVLADADFKIISALKLVDFAASTVRQILPGIKYVFPEQQNKISPLIIDKGAFELAFDNFPKERSAEKFITGIYSGVAVQIARELCYRATGLNDVPLCSLDKEKFYSVIEAWQQDLIENRYTPTSIASDGAPVDYSYTDITYYKGASAVKNSYESLGKLFDVYFENKDRTERISQRARDLINLLGSTIARTERKLALQREALLESENGEVHKRRADLITANIYAIKRGDKVLRCVDYYDEECPTVEIELDTRLSPSSNAQRLYKLYNKSKKAKIVLKEQIEIWERELVYLDSVKAFLDKAECEDDLNEIREELYRSGYSARLNGYKPNKKFKMKPLELKTSGGYTVYVGRNNIQNEYLTFKLASKSDIWFHAKDNPGSHVILITNGEEPGEADYTEAAELAAYYSKAGTGPVAVDYTAVKNVKKVPGAKPGFVIYKTNYTAYVTPRRSVQNG